MQYFLHHCVLQIRTMTKRDATNASAEPYVQTRATQVCQEGKSDDECCAKVFNNVIDKIPSYNLYIKTFKNAGDSLFVSTIFLRHAPMVCVTEPTRRLEGWSAETELF